MEREKKKSSYRNHHFYFMCFRGFLTFMLFRMYDNAKKKRERKLSVYEKRENTHLIIYL